MAYTVKPAAFNPQQEMNAPQTEIRYCLDEDSPVVDIHAHTHYEVYLFCTGDLDSYVVGNRTYRLQRGDLLLIPPRVMHHPVFLENARRYERFVLWFSQDFLSRLQEADPNVDMAFRLCKERGEYHSRLSAPGAGQALENHLRQMWNESQGNSICRDLAVLSECITFLVELNRSISAAALPAVSQQTESPLLDRIMAYVQSHYGEPITLENTARRFFVSASTVEHLFRQKLGWPFYRYVTKWRITEAQIRILSGEPVKDVAAACGYGDYSNFYKAFVRETGVPPTQYRRSELTQPSLQLQKAPTTVRQQP